jgi:hypothetical protein
MPLDAILSQFHPAHIYIPHFITIGKQNKQTTKEKTEKESVTEIKYRDKLRL